MSWKTATIQDRDHARADLQALAADGVRTSLSQVISAEGDVSAWRGGRITLGQLCKRRGWDRAVIHPEFRTNHGEPRVYMTQTQFAELTEATKRAAATPTTGFGPGRAASAPYLSCRSDGATGRRAISTSPVAPGRPRRTA